MVLIQGRYRVSRWLLGHRSQAEELSAHCTLPSKLGHYNSVVKLSLHQNEWLSGSVPLQDLLIFNSFCLQNPCYATGFHTRFCSLFLKLFCNDSHDLSVSTLIGRTALKCRYSFWKFLCEDLLLHPWYSVSH